MSLWILTRILAALAAAIGAFILVIEDVKPPNFPFKELYEQSQPQTEEQVINQGEESL
jgi:hypothetical protein